MATPIKNEVCGILKRFEIPFTKIALSSWSRWKANPDNSFLYRRTRATTIHNYMMIDAIPMLSQMEGVHLIERHESVVFLIDNRVLVRFKKADERGLSSNIPTPTALAFNDPQAKLFDLPDVSRVDVVYVLNSLETKIKDVLIVARRKKAVLWAHSIIDSISDKQFDSGAIITLPLSAPDLPPASAGMRLAEKAERSTALDKQDVGL